MKPEIQASKDNFYENYNPFKGEAVLVFSKPDRKDDLELNIRSNQWHNTGIKPYYWNFIPSNSNYGPTLFLVLTRNVELLLDKSKWAGTNNENLPVLKIIRIQNDSLLPSEDQPLSIYSFLREPTPFWVFDPFFFNNENDQNFIHKNFSSNQIEESNFPNATVIIYDTGVTFAHNDGIWRIDINVSAFKKEAFAFETYFIKSTGYYVIRCIITENVKKKIKGWWTRDFNYPSENVTLQYITVDIKDVPPQGSRLGNYDFTRFELEPRLSKGGKFLVNTFVTAVGFVVSANPILGMLYDAASLLFLCSETIEGEEKISAEELALTGFLTILSIHTGVSGIKDSLKKLLSSNKKLVPLLDSEVLKIIKEKVDNRIYDALEGLSSQEKKKIDQLVERTIKRADSPKKVIEEFSTIISPKIESITNEETILKRIFSDDLRSFRKSDLSSGFLATLGEGYEKYYSNKGTRLKKDALDWAISQRPNSRYYQILEREIGKDHIETLKRIREANKISNIPSSLSEIALSYQNIPQPYEFNKKIVYEAGLGEFLEVDHLFEKWILDALDIDLTKSESHYLLYTLIVPKNKLIAAQIPGFMGHIHNPKTNMIRKLIPYGKIKEFSMQDLWDVQSYVLQSLGVPKEILNKSLRKDFLFINSFLQKKEKIIFRYDHDLKFFNKKTFKIIPY